MDGPSAERSCWTAEAMGCEEPEEEEDEGIGEDGAEMGVGEVAGEGVEEDSRVGCDDEDDVEDDDEDEDEEDDEAVVVAAVVVGPRFFSSITACCTANPSLMRASSGLPPC